MEEKVELSHNKEFADNSLDRQECLHSVLHVEEDTEGKCELIYQRLEKEWSVIGAFAFFK